MHRNKLNLINGTHVRKNQSINLIYQSKKTDNTLSDNIRNPIASPVIIACTTRF